MDIKVTGIKHKNNTCLTFSYIPIHPPQIIFLNGSNAESGAGGGWW